MNRHLPGGVHNEYTVKTGHREMQTNLVYLDSNTFGARRKNLKAYKRLSIGDFVRNTRSHVEKNAVFEEVFISTFVLLFVEVLIDGFVNS